MFREYNKIVCMIIHISIQYSNHRRAHSFNKMSVISISLRLKEVLSENLSNEETLDTEERNGHLSIVEFLIERSVISQR